MIFCRNLFGQLPKAKTPYIVPKLAEISGSYYSNIR